MRDLAYWSSSSLTLSASRTTKRTLKRRAVLADAEFVVTKEVTVYPTVTTAYGGRSWAPFRKSGKERILPRSELLNSNLPSVAS